MAIIVATFFVNNFFLILFSLIIFLVIFAAKLASDEKKQFLISKEKKKLDDFFERQLFLIKNMYAITNTKRTIKYYIGRDDIPFYTQSKNGKLNYNVSCDREKCSVSFSYESGVESSHYRLHISTSILERIPCDIIKDISIRKQRINPLAIYGWSSKSHYDRIQDNIRESQIFVNHHSLGSDEDEFGIAKTLHIRLFEDSDCYDKFLFKKECDPTCNCRRTSWQ
jgi:hypothetical protein